MIDLLRASRHSFQSLRLSWVYTWDPGVLSAAQARADRSPQGSVGRGARRSPPGIFGRLWWAKPNRWRDEERSEEIGRYLRIVRPDQVLIYASKIGVVQEWRADDPSDLGKAEEVLAARLESTPLAAPAFLADRCEIARGEDAVCLNRPSVRATAYPVARTPHNYYWPYVTRYELEADRATGILFEYSGFVSEEWAFSLTATELAVDVQLPDSVFVFRPPPRSRRIPL